MVGCCVIRCGAFVYGLLDVCGVCVVCEWLVSRWCIGGVWMLDESVWMMYG